MDSMLSRRKMFFSGAVAMATSLAAVVNPRRLFAADAIVPKSRGKGVVTPNVSTLPWRMEDGFKTFHLIAEPLVREFAPGFKVNCWGYNGQTPGPTIEAIEGDRVRIYVAPRDRWQPR